MGNDNWDGGGDGGPRNLMPGEWLGYFGSLIIFELIVLIEKIT